MAELDGFFTDGRTATRHPVSVRVGSETIRIVAEDGSLLADWSFAGIRLLEEVHGAQAQVRLSHKKGGEAVLTLSNPDIVAQLERHGGKRLHAHWLFRPSLPMALTTLLAIVVLVAGFGYGLPQLVHPVAVLVPASWEKELGEQVVKNLAHEQGFCAGEAGQKALDGLTARILPRQKEGRGLTVRVVNEPVVNALAAPGGQIILFNGFIQQAETPEEVAGVLAHEMAHDLERHPLKSVLRAMGLQMMIGAVTGDMSAIDGIVGNVAALVLILKYGREAEQEADRIALKMLNQANLQGEGLITFFERIQKNATGVNVPEVFSTHPLTSERLEGLRGRATGTLPALDQAQWKALRTICDGAPRPDAGSARLTASHQ